MKTRNELSAREIEALHESMAQRLGDTTVPSLPQVAMKIIQLVSDPDSTIKQFAEVISGDQALTGRLLRMANSAAFAQRGGVTKVERAMVLLGLERLKALALGFHLSKSAACDDSATGFKSVWTQSLFRGCVAMKLAERINKACSGEAFVIGFMADAGVPTMPTLIGDEYCNDLAVASHPTKLFATENTKYSCTHVDVIMAMCRIWKLPERLSKPIGNHHTRPAACDVKDDVSLLNAIGYFVANIPLTPDGRTDNITTTTRDAQRLFTIDAKALQELLDVAGKDFEIYRSMFGEIVDPATTVDQILEEANNQILDEELVESNEEGVSVTAASMTLTISKASDGKAKVTVAETGGEPLVSELVGIDTPDADLRAVLMIDTASDEEFASVRETISKVAA